MAAEPGAEVVLYDLSTAHLNGTRGVVCPKEDWPTEEARLGRIAVRLNGINQRTIAVKPQNLKLAVSCLICLEAAEPMVQLGCGCRGSMGWVHEQCAIRAAAAQQERTGTWAGKHPWQLVRAPQRTGFTPSAHSQHACTRPGRQNGVLWNGRCKLAERPVQIPPGSAPPVGCPTRAFSSWPWHRSGPGGAKGLGRPTCSVSRHTRRSATRSRRLAS